MDRIRRLSMDVLAKHRQMFGRDFSDNKMALDQVTIIRSKGLKNEIAGYITKYIKREIHDKEMKLAREAEQEKTPPDQDVEPVFPDVSQKNDSLNRSESIGVQ